MKYGLRSSLQKREEAMKAPKSDDEYDGRVEDCIQAIGSNLLPIVDTAVTNGWRVDDVGAALTEIGDMLVSINGYEALSEL